MATNCSRRSLRVIEPNSTSYDSHFNHQSYDINSRKLQRYIIKYSTYIKPEKDILILIFEDSPEFHDWNKIILEQNNGLLHLFLSKNVIK